MRNALFAAHFQYLSLLFQKSNALFDSLGHLADFILMPANHDRAGRSRDGLVCAIKESFTCGFFHIYYKKGRAPGPPQFG